jgi:hypothetical protein
MGTQLEKFKQPGTIAAVDMRKRRFPDREKNSLFCAREFPVLRKQAKNLSDRVQGRISGEIGTTAPNLGAFPVFSLLSREFPELSRQSY